MTDETRDSIAPKGADEADESGQEGDSPPGDVTKYVYHVNDATGQVTKVEKLEPGDEKAEEIPMDYSGYDNSNCG